MQHCLVYPTGVTDLVLGALCFCKSYNHYLLCTATNHLLPLRQALCSLQPASLLSTLYCTCAVVTLPEAAAQWAQIWKYVLQCEEAPCTALCDAINPYSTTITLVSTVSWPWSYICTAALQCSSQRVLTCSSTFLALSSVHMDAPLLLDSTRLWSDQMPAGPESKCPSKADGHGCVLGHVRFERLVSTKADGQMQCCEGSPVTHK